MAGPLKIAVDPRTGCVAVRGSVWEPATPWADIKGLFDRLLAVPDVQSVKVDRHLGTALVHLASANVPAGKEAWSSLVRKIAAGLRESAPAIAVSDAYAALPTVRLSKLATTVIGGAVASSSPGRTRLQHPLLKGSPGLEAIVRPLLASHSGVQQVKISTATGTLFVQHAESISAAQLLVALEQIILRAGGVTVDHGSTPRLIRAGGCLGLAAVAEIVLPGLVPVAAGALVINNLPTLARGTRELVTFRWRLPALYTVIMGTTLVSGQVLAAAVMQLSIVGWYWWSNRRLRGMVDELLSSQTLNHAASRVDALLDQESSASPRIIEQSSDQANRTVGTDGAALMPLRSHAVCDALIASLARLTSENHPTPRGHERAAQFVPLTFATGAAAVLTSDIATLAAVLRPDFATGPSIAERLSLVVGLRRLLDRGWLVLRPEALERLATIDAVVVLDASLRTTGGLAVESVVVPRRDVPVLAASRQTWQLRESRTTVDVHRVSGTAAAVITYVLQLAADGAQVAVCGPGDVLETFGPEAAVRIADDCEKFDLSCTADIVALPGRCEMPELWDTLIHETRSTSGVWSVVLTCNLASVLGAFLVGLTSLHVVVLTNLGTWAAYSYFAQRLNRRPALATSGKRTLVIEAESADGSGRHAGAGAVA